MTTMSKWDYLDDDYEQYDTWEPIRKDASPTGSLTDNLRLVEPKRNGAHKRARGFQRQMKEFQDA